MNLYQILGVSSNASEDTIKRAYRKAAKDCHPDTHPGNRKAEERFKEIGEAYQILSNKEKRKKYDEKISEKRKRQNTENVKRNTAKTDYINPEDVKKEFERFFSINNQEKMNRTNVQKKVNPVDVSNLFEQYMGFKP